MLISASLSERPWRMNTLPFQIIQMSRQLQMSFPLHEVLSLDAARKSTNA